ncbi:MAG TPA: phage holin family protein [Oscillospiraceae bacterium]|nr:phage holin family protein [Oscillospiraceae bacterium]
MRSLVWRWVLNALALYLTSLVINGVDIESFAAALVAALVWGFVNTIIRPLINLITLPVNIMTVGLFTFVINGSLLWLVADTVKGFVVQSLWAGILGALLLSIISSVLSALLADN